LPPKSLKGKKAVKIEEVKCNEIVKGSGNYILQSGKNYKKVGME
jgi:hypothetical protein